MYEQAFPAFVPSRSPMLDVACRSFTASLVAWGLALGASGCASTSARAVRTVEGPLRQTAADGLARVVFVRSSAIVASAVGAAVIDVDRRTLIGEAVNASSFAVDLPSGEYLICAVPFFEDLGAARGTSDALMASAVTPVTRLSSEAGRTYVFELETAMGPRLEVVPARAGSPRYTRALATLTAGRTVALVDDAPELAPFRDPAFVGAWVERCLDSSSDDLRLRMRAADGMAAR